jgi:hypothetical protein
MRNYFGILFLVLSFVFSSNTSVYGQAIPFAFFQQSVSQPYIWIGSTGDSDWQNPSNWNTGSIPGTSNTVRFDGTMCGVNCNVSINTNVDISGIDIQASYGGIITQTPGHTIFIGTDGWNQSSGTFSGGNSEFRLGGKFALTGGVFTSTSGNFNHGYLSALSQSDGFSFTGGSFNHNSGTVSFLGSTSNTTASDSVVTLVEIPTGLSLNNLTVSVVDLSSTSGFNGASLSLNAAHTLTVNGNLLVTNGKINGGEIELKGNYETTCTNSANFENCAGGGSSELLFNGTSDQQITVASSSTPLEGSFVVNKAAGSIIQATDLSLNGVSQDLDIQGGDWNMASLDLNVIETLTLGVGTTLYTNCGTHTEGTLINNGTIIGSSSNPNISISDEAEFEGANLVFTVTFSEAVCASDTTIDYITSNMTAFSSSDYTATSGTLNVLAKSITGTITVPTSSDSDFEVDEVLNLTISSNSAGSLTDSVGVGTIMNDDVSGFTWTGLAGDDDWSSSGNWSGGTVPGITDIASFDNTCTNCNSNIDENIDVRGIILNSGYLGTITQSSGHSITVGSEGWHQAGGTFQGSDTDINLNSVYALQLAGGIFTSTSGNLSIKDTSGGTGSYRFFDKYDGATFLHNNGTVSLINNKLCGGGCGSSHSSNMRVYGSLNFYDLTLKLRDTSSSGGWNESRLELESDDQISVINNLTFENGILNSSQINLKGNLILSCSGGGASSDVCSGGGTTVINVVGSGPQTYSAQAGALGNRVIVANNSTFTPASGVTFLSLQEFTVKTGASFTAPSVMFQIGYSLGNTFSSNTNGFTVESGATFNHNNGTVALNGIVNSSSSQVSVTTVNINNVLTLYNFTVDVHNTYSSRSTEISIASGDKLLVLNDFTVNNGTIKNGEIEAQGNVAFNCPNIAINSCAFARNYDLTFTGSNSQTINVATGASIAGGVISVNKPSGEISQLSDVDFAISGQDLNLVNGQWNMAGFNLNVADTFTLDAGTNLFTNCGTHTEGTLVNNGTIVGSSSNPNITISDEAEIEGIDHSFTVMLSEPVCASDMTLDYNTSDGTASSSSDYNLAAGTLTIPAKSQTGTITISTIVDSNTEADENFSLNLSNTSHGTITDSIAEGVLINDDISGFTWTGLAGDGLWSTSGNWSGTIVPGSSDIAFFDSSCTNCNATVDTSINVSGIIINSSYSGTITMGAGNSMSVGADDYTQLAGTINLSDGVLNVSGDLTISGGIVNAGTSTLNLHGNYARTINTGSSIFNNVEFAMATTGYSFDATIVGTLKVNGDLSLNNSSTSSNGSQINTGIIEVGGNLNSTFSNPQMRPGSVVIKLVGSASQTVSGSGMLPAIEFASTGNIHLVGNVNVYSDVTYTSGTLNAGSSTLNVLGDFSRTINTGAVLLNNVIFGMVTTGYSYDVTVVGVLKVAGDLELNNSSVHSNGGEILAGTIEVEGNLISTFSNPQNNAGSVVIKLVGSSPQNVSGTGVLPEIVFASTSDINLIGNVYTSSHITYTTGVVNAGSSTLVVIGAYARTISPGNISFNNIEFAMETSNSHANDVSIVGILKINGNLLLNSTSSYTSTGEIHGGSIELAGNLSSSFVNPSNSIGTAALTLNGSSNQEISGTGMFHKLITVNKLSGNVIQQSDIDLDIAGSDLSITQGSWNMAGFNLNVADTFTLDAGTTLFTNCGTHTEGTLVNNGTIVGSSSNPNITISDEAELEGTDLIFTVTLSEAVCASSTSIDYATTDDSALSASDYTATSGTLSIPAQSITGNIVVPVSIDADYELDEIFYVNLSNTTFGSISDSIGIGTLINDDASGFTWTGLGADDNWSSAGNWSGGSVPSSSDVSVFDGTCTNCNSIIDVDINVKGLIMNSTYSGTLTQGSGQTITIGVDSWLQLGGSFLGSDSEITINSNFLVSGGSFTAPSSNIVLLNNFTTTGGAFTFTNSTLKTFGDGGGKDTIIITNGLVEFYNLHLEKQWNTGPDINISETIMIKNDLYINFAYAGSLLDGGGTLEVEGSVLVHNSVWNPEVGVKIVGSNSQTYTQTGTSGVRKIEFSKSGGTVSLIGSIYTFDLEYTSGIVDAGSSAIVIYGQNTNSYINTGSLELFDLKLNKGHNAAPDVVITGTVNVANDLYLDYAYHGNETLGGMINVTRDIVIGSLGGIFDANGTGTTNITLVGSGDQKLKNLQYPNTKFFGGFLNVDKPSGKVILQSNINLERTGQDLHLIRGGFDMAGYDLNVADTFTLDAGTNLFTNCGTHTEGTLVNNGTIVGSSSNPNIIISDESITEGGNLVFTVSLSEAVCGFTTNISYTTDDSTATMADFDYSDNDGSLAIPAGSLTGTITVSTISDVITEGTEQLHLNLVSTDQGSIADSQGVGSITE